MLHYLRTASAAAQQGSIIHVPCPCNVKKRGNRRNDIVSRSPGITLAHMIALAGLPVYIGEGLGIR
jgi:hypothetical protein